jgi:hypothetical protein
VVVLVGGGGGGGVGGSRPIPVLAIDKVLAANCTELSQLTVFNQTIRISLYLTESNCVPSLSNCTSTVRVRT